MSDLLVAADETAANTLVQTGQTLLGTVSKNGNGSLGPFNASWGASASFSGGTVSLREPDIIRIANCSLNYSLNFNFSFDLSDIIPDFCLPQICVRIPFIGRVCTPRICIDWPSVNIPINYSDSLQFSSDFRLNASLDSGKWSVDIEIVDIPLLQLSPAATAILSAIGIAAAAILATIPFIGPFLSVAALAITAAIGIAGLTGFLGPILSLFVSGLSFTIHQFDQRFVILPATSAIDPEIAINVDSLTALVQSSDEDELLLEADFSA